MCSVFFRNKNNADDALKVVFTLLNDKREASEAF